MKRQVEILEGQTVLDICIQYYGSVEALRFILEDNPSLEVENAQAGDLVFIRPQTTVDKEIKHLFSTKTPASR